MLRLARVFSFLFLAGLSWTACSRSGPSTESCAQDTVGCAVFAPGETIRLGFAGPMSGDPASYGLDASQSAMIAIEWANKDPLEGWQFELLAQDTTGTPEGGASVANRYVSDPSIVAVVGHMFSGSTEAAIPIYDDASYPMMSPSATNPSLTQLGSRVFNRVAFTDTVQGRDAAKYMRDSLMARRIAILHDGGAYGQGLAEVVRDEFRAGGGQVLFFEAITPGESDYTAPLAAIAGDAPDVVFFGGYVAEAAILVSQMRAVGLQDSVFFGGDGMYGVDFIRLAGRNAEGTIGTSVVPPESEARSRFDARYMELYGMEPGTLSPFSWNSYDCAAALVHAVRQVAHVEDGKLHVPRARLAEAVRGIQGFEALSGSISCDSNGECNTTGPIFYTVRNGKWVPAD